MTYYNHSVQNRPSGLLSALGFLQGTEDSMRIGLCIHGIQVTNVGDLCEISPWATRKARTHSQTVARRNLVHGIDRLNWPVLSDVLICRLAQPRGSLDVILRNAETASVKKAELVLRMRISLISGLSIPSRGLNIILSQTSPAMVRAAQIGFRFYVALFRRSFEPHHTLCVILLYTFATHVGQSEVVLCRRIILIGRLLPPDDSLNMVLLYPATGVIVCTQGVSRPFGGGSLVANGSGSRDCLCAGRVRRGL
jgi:hypothetical protein